MNIWAEVVIFFINIFMFFVVFCFLYIHVDDIDLGMKEQKGWFPRIAIKPKTLTRSKSPSLEHDINFLSKTRKSSRSDKRYSSLSDSEDFSDSGSMPTGSSRASPKLKKKPSRQKKSPHRTTLNGPCAVASSSNFKNADHVGKVKRTKSAENVLTPAKARRRKQKVEK